MKSDSCSCSTKSTVAQQSWTTKTMNTMFRLEHSIRRRGLARPRGRRLRPGVVRREGLEEGRGDHRGRGRRDDADRVRVRERLSKGWFLVCARASVARELRGLLLKREAPRASPMHRWARRSPGAAGPAPGRRLPGDGSDRGISEFVTAIGRRCRKGAAIGSRKNERPVVAILRPHGAHW